MLGYKGLIGKVVRVDDAPDNTKLTLCQIDNYPLISRLRWCTPRPGRPCLA